MLSLKKIILFQIDFSIVHCQNQRHIICPSWALISGDLFCFMLIFSIISCQSQRHIICHPGRLSSKDFRIKSYYFVSLIKYQASLKLLKVEEKLSKGWGGENAYHVSGYRYLLIDGDRNISRASPPSKVATLSKVKCCSILLFWNILFDLM